MDHVGLQYSMKQMSASQLCGVQLSRKMTISEIGRYYEIFSVLYFIKNKKKCGHRSDFTLFAYKVISYDMFN